MVRWKIVVADDDDAVRKLLALAIRSFGHETIEAVDGEDAVNKVVAHRPDAVFLDVLMPRLNGYGALERLRELEYPGRIVMITALSAQGTAALESSATPDAMLAKPFRRLEVGDCLERLIAASA